MKTKEQTQETKQQEKQLTNIEKLIAIQNELKVPKGNINKFGNYKYRSAEDILEALKPILFKYSALLRLSDRVVQGGNKIFVKATARIIIGDYIDFCYGYAELCEHKGMSAEQATGTASSYARKYALNGLFLIDETEQDADHDNKKVEQENKVKYEPKPLNVIGIKQQLKGAKSLVDLQNIWSSLSNEAKLNLEISQLKDELKKQLP